MFSDPQKNIEQFHVDPGMSVVDLGSGSGFYSLACARVVGDSGRVISVDINKDLLSKLKKEAEHEGLLSLDIVWGDIDEDNGSTLSDNIADRVLITNTLFQVEKRENVIKEARRILKKGGSLLVVDWSESFGGMGPQPADIVSKDDVKKMCLENGFELFQEINAGEHHYGIIFKAI
ncbi:MAG: ubiquinone/menaquinone biosynthesis C-methylase UbiE [Candidatus Paceibacteria bacterium]|jgi:ubiquinone/menaquinone biosynthesis C-methylase UbiE